MQEKVAISARWTRAWFLPSIRQQTSRPMPKPPHTPLFSFTEIDGWSSLERATPLSIRTLTVALLNEALKVSARRHWRFLHSQTLLNFGCRALPAAIMTPLPLRWLSLFLSRKCVHYYVPISRPRLAVKFMHKCGACGNTHASIWGGPGNSVLIIIMIIII